MQIKSVCHNVTTRANKRSLEVGEADISTNSAIPPISDIRVDDQDVCLVPSGSRRNQVPWN
jgi:hypothetical protein